MSTAALQLFSAAIATPPRKRFTRDEVERLAESGFFAGLRCELIDGDLIEKMGQTPAHASAIHRVQVCLMRSLGVMWVRNQAPIEPAPSDQELCIPEPDIAVAEPKSEYEFRHPRGDEVLLVI